MTLKQHRQLKRQIRHYTVDHLQELYKCVWPKDVYGVLRAELVRRTGNDWV